MARLTSDCQRLSNILAWGVMDFIWGTTLMIGIGIVKLVYNWILALGVLAVVPVLFAVSVFFRKRILRTSRLVRKTNSKITAVYNEGIMGIRTTKVFVRQAKNLRDFDRLAEKDANAFSEQCRPFRRLPSCRADTWEHCHRRSVGAGWTPSVGRYAGHR